LSAEMTLDLAAAGAPLGVRVVWKSNGFLTPEAVAAVAPALAAVSIDLKAADDQAHLKLTGAPLAPVLEALRGFVEAGVWVEVCTPLIPEFADSPEQLTVIAEHVAALGPGVPWHPARFTPAFRMRGPAPTSPAQLAEAVRIGKAAGLRYTYVERALGDDGRATGCPACGECVVERRIWGLAGSRLRDGCCPACGTAIEGVW
jgi:pyruvate formate lyase activating enzyme